MLSPKWSSEWLEYLKFSPKCKFDPFQLLKTRRLGAETWCHISTIVTYGTESQRRFRPSFRCHLNVWAVEFSPLCCSENRRYRKQKPLCTHRSGLAVRIRVSVLRVLYLFIFLYLSIFYTVNSCFVRILPKKYQFRRHLGTRTASEVLF